MCRRRFAGADYHAGGGFSPSRSSTFRYGPGGNRAGCCPLCGRKNRPGNDDPLGGVSHAWTIRLIRTWTINAVRRPAAAAPAANVVDQEGQAQVIGQPAPTTRDSL